MSARSLARRLARGLTGPGARRLAARGRLALERGTARACPCCGGSFRRFLPFGVVPRPDARCPSCGSLERHRLVWLFLSRRRKLLEGARRLLHVAPEAVLAARLREVPGLRTVSADLARAADLRLDVTALPFPDASFGAVLCNHVLEHVADDRGALRELRRVLRPGGWALLQVPLDPQRAETLEDDGTLDPQERTRRFGQPDHVRVYGRDYAHRLREAGFAVSEHHLAAELGPAESRRRGLDPAELLHLCRV